LGVDDHRLPSPLILAQHFHTKIRGNIEYLRLEATVGSDSNGRTRANRSCASMSMILFDSYGITIEPTGR
jgi:hypothetical protein